MVTIAASLVCVASFGGSIFDDAKVWWKFDAGGANGTVATTAQIKDARAAALRSKALAEVVNGCECTYHHEAPGDQGGNGAGPSLKLV